LHVHHTFMYISLRDYNVKVPILTFCRGREHKTTIFFFFFFVLIQSFRIQLQRNLLRAIKFEAARLHLLSDVFVAVAVVVVKLPSLFTAKNRRVNRETTQPDIYKYI